MEQIGTSLDSFMADLKRRNPGEPEFHQAVTEVAEKVWPYLEAHPELMEARIFERLTEPDRVIMFRVTWADDHGRVQVNKGYRIQFNGPIRAAYDFILLLIWVFSNFSRSSRL